MMDEQENSQWLSVTPGRVGGSTSSLCSHLMDINGITNSIYRRLRPEGEAPWRQSPIDGKMGRSDWTWLSVSARRPSPALKQGNVRHLIFKLNQRTASACKTISQNIRVLTKKLFAVDVDVLKEVVVILPLRTTLPVQSNERKSVNIRRTDTKERPLVFEAIFLFVCFFPENPPTARTKNYKIRCLIYLNMALK